MKSIYTAESILRIYSNSIFTYFLPGPQLIALFSIDEYRAASTGVAFWFYKVLRITRPTVGINQKDNRAYTYCANNICKRKSQLNHINVDWR